MAQPARNPDAREPHTPLQILPAMLHAVFCQTADVFNAPQRQQPRAIQYTNAQLRTSIPSCNDRYQFALDQLEIEIIRAKAVLTRDLAKIQQTSEAENAQRLAAEEANAAVERQRREAEDAKKATLKATQHKAAAAAEAQATKTAAAAKMAAKARAAATSKLAAAKKAAIEAEEKRKKDVEEAGKKKLEPVVIINQPNHQLMNTSNSAGSGGFNFSFDGHGKSEAGTQKALMSNHNQPPVAATTAEKSHLTTTQAGPAGRAVGKAKPGVPQNPDSELFGDLDGLLPFGGNS